MSAPEISVVAAPVGAASHVAVLGLFDASGGCERPIKRQRREALTIRCERVVADEILVPCRWCLRCRSRRARSIVNRATALLEGSKSVRLVTLSPSVAMHLAAEARVKARFSAELAALAAIPDGIIPKHYSKKRDRLREFDLQAAGFIPAARLSASADRMLTAARRVELYDAVQRFVKRVRSQHFEAEARKLRKENKGMKARVARKLARSKLQVIVVAEKHPGDKPGGSGELTGHVHFHIVFSVAVGGVISKQMLKRADGDYWRSRHRRADDGRLRRVPVSERWLMKISRLPVRASSDAVAKYLGAAKYISKDNVFCSMSRHRRVKYIPAGRHSALLEWEQNSGEIVSMSIWQFLRDTARSARRADAKPVRPKAVVDVSLEADMYRRASQSFRAW